MELRKLGNSGLKVPPLCLGGNVFGWTIDERASLQVLDAATDAGLNFIDTADMYSVWKPGNKGGESETIIGNWLKRGGKREQVIIATKVGMELAPDKKGLKKAYILQAVEDSLTRLRTDYIDLYQSHQDDQETPLEETLEAYSELVKQGMVRAIGTSNYKADRLEEAMEVSKEHDYPGYECLQPHYNLYDRAEYEQNLEPVCEKYGLGVISYFSLASGFLTGKYRSEADFHKSARGPGMKKYLNDRGFRILKALDEVAKEIGSTPGNVALAWLMARPSITAPIASATSVKQVKDLADATKVKLTSEAVEKLDLASAEVKGA